MSDFNVRAPLISRIETLRQSEFIKNASKLLGYTVVAQIATLAAAPLLSRLFSPVEFGLFGIISTFATTVSGLTCLTFDAAVPAPKRDADAALLAVGAFSTAIVVSLVLSGAYTVFVATKFLGFGIMPLWSGLLVYCFLLLFAGSSILQYWCIRTQLFDVNGRSVLVTSFARVLVQIGGGIIGLEWAGLAVGEIAGRLASGSYLFRSLAGSIIKANPIGIRAVWNTLVANRRFAIVILPSVAIDAIGAAFVIPAIGLLFGTAAAGQFFLMRRVLDLPMAVLSRAISDTFYGKVAEYGREGPERVRPFLVRTFAMISLGMTVLLAPLIAFGPTAFALVFGEHWRTAGLLASFTVPGVIVNLAVSPISRVFLLTRRLWLRYIFSAIMLFGIAASLSASALFGLSLVWATGLLALTTFIAYVAFFIVAYAAASHLHVEPAGLDYETS